MPNVHVGELPLTALAMVEVMLKPAFVEQPWRQDPQAVQFASAYERAGWSNYGEWFVKPLTDDVEPSGEPVDDN